MVLGLVAWEGDDFEGDTIDVGGFGHFLVFVGAGEQFPDGFVGGGDVINLVGGLFLVALGVVGVGVVGRSYPHILTEAVDRGVV